LIANDLVKKLREYSTAFYAESKLRLFSIILTGSLAWEVKPQSTADADVMLVTRFYDILIKRKYERYMKARLPGIEMDVGVYPASRIREEKSLFLYDTKHHGIILAGNDALKLITEITVEDLYPFEGFRLLLNRIKDLLTSIENYTPTNVTLNPVNFKIATRRIIQAYVDSYLIFNKVIDPNHERRLSIFLSMKYSLPKIREIQDARKILLEGLQYGLEAAKIDSFDSLLNKMKLRFKYPYLFRFYTILKTRRPSSLYRNPIFDAYRLAYRFILNHETGGKPWSHFKTDLIRIWESAPQPILT